ncbi:MAG: M48 family peptidase [Legionella sp.]|nr:MAG: M48 family peptidase [Legionella sp.]
MIIKIDGIPIQVTRKRIKSFNVRIYPPDGEVRVSAPLKFSEKLIRQHLLEKKDWIKKQRNHIQSLPPPPEEGLQTGAPVDFLGSTYVTLITEHNGPVQIRPLGHLLHCYLPYDISEAQKKLLLDRWYRYQLETIVPQMIDYWAFKIGVLVNEWGIKKMKTRWGSCNPYAKRIWLNLNLIKKNRECIEYVLVHELVHLLEASHNARFYELMTQFMPNWRDYQVLLEGRHDVEEHTH